MTGPEHIAKGEEQMVKAANAYPEERDYHLHRAQAHFAAATALAIVAGLESENLRRIWRGQ